MPRKPVPPVHRFLQKIEFTEGCWIWAGGTNGRYGIFGAGSSRDNREQVYVHRYAYTLWCGEIPDGMNVCHTCDVPLCVRPEHLFLGTQADNLQDMVRKRRHSWQAHPERVPRGEAHPSTRLSDAGVEEIRNLRSKGWTQVSLAKRFGVGRTQIGRIVRGEQRVTCFSAS